MGISERIAGIVVVAFLVNPAWAQSPPSQSGPRPRPAVRPTSTHVVVRDFSGAPIDGVKVAISGAGSRQVTTNGEGVVDVALADGTYRLRFEREGFVTFEREVTIRNSRPAPVEVVLSAAPPPPAPPPPPPPPPRPARQSAVPRPVAPGPPVNVSIPAFLEKNFIGRDPLKESVIGCTPDATTRLLQLRDPIAVHTHPDLDEILYVVAGEGDVYIGNESMQVGAGSLIVIPRGLAHKIDRRGRNPLVVLSTLAGGPCRALSTSQ